MAEVVGVVAAAFQFAELAQKLIKLAREIHSGAEPGVVHRKITQLETLVEIAGKIANLWIQDDALMERILQQCISTVTDLDNRLRRVDVAKGDGFRKKTRKAFLAQWEKDDVEELFRQLNRDQMALLLHRNFSSDNQSHLIQKVIDGMRQVLDDRLQYSNPQGEDERCFLKGVFVTDPRDDRNALLTRKGRRVEGTCVWVTETDVYRSWLSSTPGSTGLMLQGGPGKGKTMMAIYLTEQLELLAGRGESVLYFFCDNRNPKQNNAMAVVRCLLWQLCRLKPALLCHGIRELQERGGSINNLLVFDTLWRIFDTMRKDANAGTVTCVIDGLDECDEDSVFLILDKLWRLDYDPRFRFLVLCRPLKPRQQLPAANPSVDILRLDPDADEEVNRDVFEFIRQRVQEIANSSPERKWPEKLRLHVEATLQRKAGGTFLWVGFVTQDLQRKTSTEVRQSLKSLPSDLNEIYDRILKDVPAEYRAQIRSLLHWVSLAAYPLEPADLASLIHKPGNAGNATNSEPESDAELYLETEEELLQHYLDFVRHFVFISQGKVHFVHQSAKDYLLRSSRDADPTVEYFRIADLEVAHEERARDCLDCLHRQWPIQIEDFDTVGRKYSFLKASAYWTRHIGRKKYGSEAVSQEEGLLVEAIRHDDIPDIDFGRLSGALLAVTTDARAYFGRELDQALIEAAKLPGVTDMVQILVNKGADPNATDKKGNTALHYLAKRTDPSGIEAARFLLSQSNGPIRPDSGNENGNSS
ncbi:NACHT and Ankyrin domain-containing protein [Verticillium dahliae VdLs.17]|uniref:NACHT and Ankyrin domain-containing protein n=1 Tax=Verticillium dahliae (strain VdLs.17 / ATCC MYA-4575 / FGSC 10137) TaxID=498257 RepID=G2XBF9_VERDV|nr:NACHT and Ankyrin domain-containing protein [Verticillium dahliae VdLs.17]EGY16327.1 NACHT and Ankyrin domain-containing protein [Verticillium dahliae VdLs.17]KAH6699385.1 NACHT and ankyrin domain-containing protein [Verticillium dahliae]